MFDISPVPCDKLQDTSVVENVIGVIIIFGVYISWLPQQIAFIRRKSTFGVSVYFIILTQLANWFPLINSLYLDWDRFTCCSEISFWKCQMVLIPIYQLAISTFSVFCIHFFFVLYFNPKPPESMLHSHSHQSTTSELESPDWPVAVSSSPTKTKKSGFLYDDEDDAKALINSTLNDDKPLLAETEDYEISPHEHHHPHHEKNLPGKKRFQWSVFFSYLVCMACLIIMGYLWMWATAPYSKFIQIYADSLGIIGTFIVLLQFTPQIYETYRLKTSGNLSTVMLVIQSPGTWIWFVDLIWGGVHWATWLSTLVAAIQVTMLLIQVIYYDYIVHYLRKRKGEHLEQEYTAIAYDDDQPTKQGEPEYIFGE